MYLRTTQRRRKDGSLVRYLQLAHNHRLGGVTRAEVLLNLGREDELDVEGLRRLARSIRRYTDPGAESAAAIEHADGLEVVGSRPLGGAWLLDALWRRLGIPAALRELLGARRFATDVERVLFALVANRALAPCSKLAAAEWASEDVAIPGLVRMDDDQAYRALDLLVEADAEARVQEAVFFACADLLNLEVDLLFFDTTSTYFEAEPDTADEGERGRFRALGHSKDHRPDLPQVVIGLAVTREGIPVRVWVWPGNTNDQTVITQVKDDLRGWRLGRCVWVVDRGFSSDEREPALPDPRRRPLDRRRADARRLRGCPGGARPPRPLPDGARQPPGQGRPGRRGRQRPPLRRLPQPGRGRARQGRARRAHRPARGRARADRTGPAQGEDQQGP
jgi:hypothetical protein